MSDQRCQVEKTNGEQCKNPALPGRAWCRFHSPNVDDIAKRIEDSRRGGLTKAWAGMPSLAPLAEAAGVPDLDLTTPAGLRGFLAATLRQLAGLPFDVKVANSIAQLAGAARSIIETSDLDERLAALEAAEAARDGSVRRVA